MNRLRGIRACVFDAYGTIFDFASAAARCEEGPEPRRAEFTKLWRDKQLQYSWLRALQGRYVDFWEVTRDSLDFTLESMGLETPGLRDRLMQLYLTLAAFPEAPDALRSLRGAGFRVAILSNGSPTMLEAAISGAGLSGLFDAVLSVDRRKPIRPIQRSINTPWIGWGWPPARSALLSSNAWDAHAASDFGMRVVWCNRYRQRRERLPGSPNFEIETLAELPALLST